MRFTSATFAVWLDSVPQQFIDELKQTPGRAWKLKKGAPSPEAQAMADLVDVAHRQGILFHPLANPGVDVLFLLHEGAVKAVFPEYPGHVEALAMKRRKEESRADWYQSLIRNPKRVSAFQEIAEKMGELRLKPHPDLPAVVAEACRVAESSARSR